MIYLVIASTYSAFREFCRDANLLPRRRVVSAEGNAIYVRHGDDLRGWTKKGVVVVTVGNWRQSPNSVNLVACAEKAGFTVIDGDLLR